MLGKPEHLSQRRIRLGDAIVGRGKIDAFAQGLKQFRETCFVFALAGNVAGKAADALDHAVTHDGMENTVEIMR